MKPRRVEDFARNPSGFRVVLPAVRRSGWSQQHRVEQYVRDAVATGVLAEGSRLPSPRAAAKTSSLSVNTIMNAYKALVAEGVVRAVPRDGFFVECSVRYCDFFVPRPPPP